MVDGFMVGKVFCCGDEALPGAVTSMMPHHASLKAFKSSKQSG